MFQKSPVTERVKAMRQRYRDAKPKIDLSRYKLVTEFYQNNPQLTGILKRAKNLRNLFEHMPVLINEDEVIVGWQGTRVRDCPLYPETSWKWFMEELRADNIRTREVDPYELDPEDEQYLFIELAQLFGGGHAVEQRQLDIHEHHVVYRFIAGEKAHGVAVDGAFEGGALFFEKRRHAVAEGLRLGGRIFHDGDLDHKNILLQVPKPPLRNFPYERSLIKSINEKEAQVKGKS